jgi:uncharacterized membrane protein YphA (DoxX/SURF4 family)
VRLSTLLRVGLAVLAANQAIVGLWALAAPRAFYEGFPAPGHPWVALLPPYNEHLVRDVGALNLALATVLVGAAVTLDLTTVRVALLALAVFAVPHTVFHAGHLKGYPSADAVAQTVGFVLQLLIIGGVFALTWRLPVKAGVRPTPHVC